jgi:hypothetical protein
LFNDSHGVCDIHTLTANNGVTEKTTYENFISGFFLLIIAPDRRFLGFDAEDNEINDSQARKLREEYFCFFQRMIFQNRGQASNGRSSSGSK